MNILMDALSTFYFEFTKPQKPNLKGTGSVANASPSTEKEQDLFWSQWVSGDLILI